MLEINLEEKLPGHERLQLCSEVWVRGPEELPVPLSGARGCINGATGS